MLQDEQVLVLADLYCKKKSVNKQKDKETIITALKFLDAQFGENLNLARIAENVQAKTADANFDIIEKFIANNCKSDPEHGLRFDPKAAQRYIAELRHNLPSPALRHQEEDISRLGLQEKFLKGILAEEEWLREVDVRRFLHQAELTDKVQICRLDQANVLAALQYEQNKHVDDQNPYAINLLVKQPAQGVSHESVWLNVRVNVHPINHTVHIVADCSTELSTAERGVIIETIKQAVDGVFHESAWIKSVKAFDEAHSHPDGYSNGLRALHQLLQQLDVLGDNAFANEFANSKIDSASLYKVFLQNQLSALRVSPEQLNNLNPVLKGQFQIDRLASDAVRGVISGLDDASAQSADVLQPKSVIEKVIGSYTPAVTNLLFPGTSDEAITAADTDHFLKELHGLLIKSDKVLSQLIISPCDPQILSGLNSYFAEPAHDQRIDTLQLDFVDRATKARTLSRLKVVLMNASENGLNNLIINDPKRIITPEDYAVLRDFAQARNISVAIQLPKNFQDQTIQRDFDRIASTNQRARRIAKVDASQAAATLTNKKDRPKRTRPMVNKDASKQADVELQKSTEAEANVQAQQLKTVDDKKAPGELEPLSFQEFLIEFKQKQFQISAAHYCQSDDGLQRLWSRVFGEVNRVRDAQGLTDGNQRANYDIDNATTYANPNCSAMSPEAAEQILAYPHLFQFGIDSEHLPRGFTLVEYPKGSERQVLHFEKNALLLQKHDPLSQKLAEQPQADALAYDVLTSALENYLVENQAAPVKLQWDRLQQEPYDKAALDAFARHLPNILLLNDNQQETLFRIASPEGQLNPQALDFMMALTNHPSHFTLDLDDPEQYNREFDQYFSSADAAEAVSLIKAMSAEKVKAADEQHIFFKLVDQNSPGLQALQPHLAGMSKQSVNALLALHNAYGDKGLLKLAAAWEDMDPQDLNFLKQHLFNRVNSFEPYVSDDFIEATKMLKGYSGAEKDWLLQLLGQHFDAVGHDDLKGLLDSFKAFSAAIKAKNLSFYSGAQFKDIQNMPVALARMVNILNRCDSRDVRLQWNNISSISLQSDAAIRAMTGEDRANVVLPEFEFTPLSYDDNYGYNTWQQWQAICASENLDQVRLNYFRFVAHQQYRQPMSFYRHIDKLISEKNYSDETRRRFYALIADSTTGQRNVPFMTNEADAQQHADVIFERFDNVLFKPLRSKVQDELSKVLLELNNVPPLPVFNRLINLIADAATVEWSVNLKGMMDKLSDKMEKVVDANDLLNQCLALYGDVIYKGMTFYTDDDYQSAKQRNTSVFFEHLDAMVDLSNIGDTKFVQLVSGVISTFGIKKDDVLSIASIHDIAKYDPTASANLKYLLTLLQDIDKVEVEGRRLNSHDLVKLMNMLTVELMEVAEKDHKDVIQKYVQREVGPYFSEGYFKRLQSEGIPKKVLDLIDSTFPNSEINRARVKSLLEQFPQKGANQHFQTIVQKIALLGKDMSSQELHFLIEQLSNPLLYPEPTDVEIFNQILDGMMARGGAHDFFYFMAQEDVLRAQRLPEKTVYYLTKVLPAVEAYRREHQATSQLAKADILPLLCKQILRSDVDEFSSKVVVEHHDEAAVINVKGILSDAISALNSGEVVKASKLQQRLMEQEQQLPAFMPALHQLNEHLEQTKQKVIAQTLANSAKKKDESAKQGNFLMRGFRALRKAITRESAATIEAPKEEVKLDVRVLSDALRYFNDAVEGRTNYDATMMEFVSNVDRLLAKYPGTKPQVLQFQSYFMTGKSLVQTWNDFNKVSAVFLELDENTIRSLCHHFDDKNGEHEFISRDLVDLFDNLKDIAAPQRVAIINMFSVLLDNEKLFNLREAHDFINECKQHPELIEQLTHIYQSAPFPSMQMLLTWHQEASPPADYNRVFQEKYSQFEREPAPREAFNGFHLDEALEKAPQIRGYTYTTKELVQFEAAVKRARTMSTRALRSRYDAFATDDPVNTEELVAVSAELLYRAKAKQNPNPAPGDTFEINTTQYLAIHSLLKAGKHVTSGIGTGEGKSRIMMIANATQLAQGKTVDFVTSDVQLATRDYLEFRAYFNLLGKETNLIQSDTLVQDYKLGGLNFSDAANLSLFRNKARSEGQDDLVIDPIEENRALMLDEADKTYFDVADTRFNYSTAGDPTLKDMGWVYTQLTEFFAQEDLPQNQGMAQETRPSYLFYKDRDSCNERFLQFVRGNVSDEQYQRLTTVSREQLEAWQHSAVVARQLELNVDYVIESDTVVQTPQGPKISSEAQLVSGNRVQKNSKFSFGVHQCLHARLNILKNTPREDIEKMLPESSREALLQVKDELEYCTQIFHIEDEKQIIYSSTSKGLLDDYRQGNLLAVTGTPGSIIERDEAAPMFGTDQDPMKFLDVPRHRGLKRIDQPIRLTANKSAQIQTMVDEIIIARRKNQPVLLICESDNESAELYKALSEELAKRGQFDKDLMQRIASSSVDETDKIKQAGQPQMLTISTDMVGRGTDIKLKGAARDSGLKVLVSYLPRERDLEQIIGRAGRAGQDGETRLILDKERLCKRLNKADIKDGFFTNTETYIRQQQALFDRKKQIERDIKNTNADFTHALKDNFYKEFRRNVTPRQQAALLPHWKRFMDDSDKLWTEYWPKILDGLDPLNPDPEQVDRVLAEYRGKVIEKWEGLCRNVDAEKVAGVKGVENPYELLLKKKDIPPCQLSDKMVDRFQGFKVEKFVEQKAKIYDRYDPSHDGRAVLYSRSFEKLRAVFRGERSLFADFNAWRKGTGLWFPNVTALFRGQISLGEFFTGKRHAPPSTTEALKLDDDAQALREQLAQEQEQVDKTTYQGLQSKLGTNVENETPEVDASATTGKAHDNKQPVYGGFSPVQGMRRPRSETHEEIEPQTTASNEQRLSRK